MESYYLGANTKDGFYSLYQHFPPKGAYLHILKGGPGTGKSSLLKAIAKSAKEHGMNVEQILCSGDPDSLDGIYIPALRQAWADGTAPHVLEPGLLGVTGDYIDLSGYLILPFSEAEKQELLSLLAQNKECYRLAYTALAEHAAMRGRRETEPDDGTVQKILTLLPEKGGKKTARRCFLTAISCKGILVLEEQLRDHIILQVSPADITIVAEQLQARGYEMFLCPSPLEPEVPEALILPQEKLYLKAVPSLTEGASNALREAIFHLEKAKQCHDQMEAVYRPHMDFRALSEHTEALIHSLFS